MHVYIILKISITLGGSKVEENTKILIDFVHLVSPQN